MNSEYGVTATPTVFIIDKDGAILTSYQGEEPYETLAAYLSGLEKWHRSQRQETGEPWRGCNLAVYYAEVSLTWQGMQ